MKIRQSLCCARTHCLCRQVDNFPGFPAGVTGPDLMNGMRDQASRWGGVFETEDVEEVDFSSRPFVVRSTSRTVKAQTVIIATGLCVCCCCSCWLYICLPRTSPFSCCSAEWRTGLPYRGYRLISGTKTYKNMILQ